MSRRPSQFPKLPNLIRPLRRRSLQKLLSMSEPQSLFSKLRMLRWGSLLVGISNLLILLFGLVLLGLIGCDWKFSLGFVPLMAGVKVLAMVGAGKAQHAAAEAIVNRAMDESIAVDAVIRHEKRVRYRRWLYWTRFGMAITGLQFFAASYLTFTIFTNFSNKKCFWGQDTSSEEWKKYTMILFVALDWMVVILQFFTGSDILRWRSFYSTHDSAWKAYYREVFDHGIREALCCLGRSKYLTVLEEDEVYSVARLLGDLVAYRASGTGHLEFLAGLALFQMEREMPMSEIELLEAPKEIIQEAIILHPFAEAAYTGPLLDFGRNPILFPCAWLYRQGILTPWTRNRRPALEGDNWWRGHASAFLRFVNLKPETLLRGRVCQTKREAAYFIVALHDKRTIVITVRGTETPEDLLTDGLCREIDLNCEDLDGLVNNERVSQSIRERVMSTFPHYGHGGIIESARELFMQIDGDLDSRGFLTSLLGEGGKLHGYKIRIVGHSLGGAVATLLGIRLYRRYPNLHVYSYGPPPCLDNVISEACSDFITTIVFNDEFSSRLSINSILRLRSAAITALSDSSSADSAMIGKLARRIFNVNYTLGPSNGTIVGTTSLTEGQSQCQVFREIAVEPPEMFLAGKIIHIVRQQRGLLMFMFPLWRWWNFGNGSQNIPFRAYVAKRESFRDLIVTPFMFTDHLPWRCHYALQRSLEAQNCENAHNNSDCVEQYLV